LTTQFDLSDEEQARRWLAESKTPDFLSAVTALTIAHHREFVFSLAKPRGFRDLSMSAAAIPPEGKNKGGERLTCFADEVQLVLLVHRELQGEQQAVRLSLSKPGRRRFDPERR